MLDISDNLSIVHPSYRSVSLYLLSLQQGASCSSEFNASSVTLQSRRRLIPSDLSGNDNFCRSDPLWPFVTADPICAVWDETEDKVTFDLCSVPHCSRKRERAICNLMTVRRKQTNFLACEITYSTQGLLDLLIRLPLLVNTSSEWSSSHLDKQTLLALCI